MVRLLAPLKKPLKLALNAVKVYPRSTQIKSALTKLKKRMKSVVCYPPLAKL